MAVGVCFTQRNETKKNTERKHNTFEIPKIHALVSVAVVFISILFLFLQSVDFILSFKNCTLNRLFTIYLLFIGMIIVSYHINAMDIEMCRNTRTLWRIVYDEYVSSLVSLLLDSLLATFHFLYLENEHKPNWTASTRMQLLYVVLYFFSFSLDNSRPSRGKYWKNS